MPYQINGHAQFIESLPGTGTISHQFQPHHYDLKCGDVYLVTADGNIMFIGMDSEQSQCCWNSRNQHLYPSYYRPVHAQRPDAYAQCLEAIANPQWAFTEDCLMVLLCPAERLQYINSRFLGLYNIDNQHVIGKNNSNTPYAGIDKINITGCCDDGIVGHAIVTYNKIKETILNEDLFIDGQKVASQSFNPANSTSVSSVGSCRCGFVYATLGYQDKVTGDITYTVEPAYYTNTGLERITSALNIPQELEDDISLNCCDGYGWAIASKRAQPVISLGEGTNPLIPRKDPQYTPPAVTDANLDTYLNDPGCTIATFDDGTKAVGRWEAHFMTYCDETDAGADRWVEAWHFRGIDGVFKTVQNPYRLQHNPMGAMDTNQSWVPFARTKPEGMSAIFRITEDGYFDGLIANDTDIISTRCNFYNTDDKRYDGIDVTTLVGDLDHDFNVSMTWPDPNEVICEPGTVIEYSTLEIRKTINNPYNAGCGKTREPVISTHSENVIIT